MEAIQLYSSSYITTEYRPNDQLICHTIHQSMENQVEMLKDALDIGTEALSQYKVTKWLSDDRKNGPLPQEFLVWSLDDWCPRTVDAGWKYWAVVVPNQIKAAGTLTPVINQLYTLGLRMMVFTTVDEAQKWLDSME